MTYIPILGALALAAGTIFEKLILRKKKLDIKKYQTLVFLAIVLAMAPFIYFFWKLDAEALSLKNILIFLGVVVLSILANLLTFYSLKGEKVTNLEPARLLEPLFTILISLLFSLIFGEILYERNIKIIIPALIAALALIFSHVRKYHLEFNKYFLSAILGSFFFALELVISVLILNYYSPITFYFFRCASIFLISLAIFRPKLSGLDKKTYGMIFLVGAIWVLYRVIVYYGYLNYGIVFTTLIIMLGPVFIYILANRFLKEKLNWKNIVSAIVIIACVLYATLS